MHGFAVAAIGILTIFDALKNRAENFDRCITTLIADLHDHGLSDRVMLGIILPSRLRPILPNRSPDR